MLNKKYVLLSILLVFLIGLVGCNEPEKVSDSRIIEVNMLVKENKYDEAIAKANELFVDDPKKLESFVKVINNIKESDKEINDSRAKINDIKNSSSRLEIQNNTSKIDNGYIYITGSVKNTGNTDINYFEIRADFLGSKDDVIDSDYTNDGLILKPCDMREFEIMHKYNEKYDGFKLSVGDVK